MDLKEAVASALVTGTVNCFAAIGAGMGGAMIEYASTIGASKAFGDISNAVCSVGTEAICDILGILINLFD